MKAACLILLLSLAGPSLHAAGAVQAPAGPQAAETVPATRVVDLPNAVLAALKQNDFGALLDSGRDGDLGDIARDWNENVVRAKVAAEPDADSEPATLLGDPMTYAWAKLQTDAGLELLADELQPLIAEQAETSIGKFNLGFGVALAAIASDKNLSAEQSMQLTQLMYATQNWTHRVDFADPQRLRRALAALSRLVRQTGLKRMEDVQSLAFEDMVIHGDTLLVTIKQVLGAYDLDVDQVLASVRVSELDAFGNQATLRIEGQVLGVDLAYQWPKIYTRGQWLDAERVAAEARHASEEADEDLEVSVEFADEPPPPPDAAPGSCSPGDDDDSEQTED